MQNLENLKNGYPKMPEAIKNMVQREVEKQLKGEERKTQSKMKTVTRKKMSWKKAMLLVAAATMALGTTVFAGVRIYQWQTQKAGSYGLKSGVVARDAETNTAGGQAGSAPEEVPVLTIEANYLPEGMEQTEDGKFSYANTPNIGGISIAAIAMDQELNADNLPMRDTDITVSEQIMIGEHEAVYLEKDVTGQAEISFNKKIYVAYPEYWQILEIYIGSNITKEEALKIAENMEVSPSGKTQLLTDLSAWSEDLMEASGDIDETFVSTNEMKNLHKVGDEISILNIELADTGVTAVISNVQILDDNSLLDVQYEDERLLQAFDENGTLVDNKIDYVQSGDGVDSLDTVISTETVKQKLVLVTVEYTNKNDTVLDEFMINAAFIGMVQNSDGYTLYDRVTKVTGADAALTSSIGSLGEADYYDIRGGKRSNNYITNFQPDEMVTVHFAKVVNEDELDKMYLSMDGYAYNFTEQALAIGYVDIRQG